MGICPLDQKGGCTWYGMGCLYCSRKLLELAGQQLRWSLPFGIGRYFKTYEHIVECERRSYERPE